MQYYASIFLIQLLYYFCVLAALKPNDVRNHLGTRTPYRFKYNKDDSKIKFPGCKDSKIWMVIRHGTRLPSAEDITSMSSTLKNLKYEVLMQHAMGKGDLNKQQLELLEDWSSDLVEEREKYLTYEGQSEMLLLAERMQRRFPNTIKQKYDNQTFLFRYTATERAQQSARYFANGLFSKKEAKDVIFAPAAQVDPVLRFYKHCDRWQKQVKKNPDTFKENREFGRSREMSETLETVSKRLGLNRVLSLDDVILMYKVCGYETSWHKHQVSPWCYAFDLESAKRLEYHDDLKHYWQDGYGHELTYRQACLSIKNMFDNFSHNAGPNATFLFAHSGTLLKILSHLNLYKPQQHMRGDSMDPQRSWKTTNIDCFAANLAFVLYKCKTGDHVITLHQERVIKLPMCENDLCPLASLKEHFHESIYNCDYTDMCEIKKNDEL